MIEKFSRTQRDVFKWQSKPETRNADGIICEGTVRSGKSFSAALAYIINSFVVNNYPVWGMSGRTIGGVYKNVIIPIDTVLQSLGFKTTMKSSENTYLVEIGGKKKKFELFGGEGNYAYRAIQGRTFGGFLFDELTLHNKSFFQMAITRLSVENSKWWGTTNPDSPYHWVKKEYIDLAEEKNLIVKKFVLMDNPALSDKVKAMYDRMYSGVFRKRYIEGLWILAEGVVYDMFRAEEHCFSGELFAHPERFVAVDYGTTNPFVALYGSKEVCDNPKYIIHDEYCWDSKAENKQKTDAEYANDMERFYSENGLSKNVPVIIDPSAESFKVEMRRHKFTVINAENSVIDGIRTTASLMNQKRLLISRRCKTLLRELTLYSWDSRAQEKGIDKPIKEEDHANDALRYLCFTTHCMDNGGSFEAMPNIEL